MLRFNVLELDEMENLEYIKNPPIPMLKLADFYREKLMEATASQTNTIFFENIPFVKKTSENFQNISLLERSIMDYLKENTYPRQVNIVCNDSKIAELYKVVYNFYYPGSKAERIEDENWD